jgi:ketosteroid isomerase-like protein
MSEEAIRRVIESAYIEGIQLEQDREKVRAGFHPEFRMLIRQGDGLVKVDPETFVARVAEARERNPETFEPQLTYEIRVVDQAESVAVARIDLARGGKKVFTDYMFLYAFDDGWKIVSKVFHAYPR